MGGTRQHRAVLTAARDGLGFALAQLRQDRRRFAAALCGLAVPLILLMMQLAFLQGTSTLVNRVYEFFDFDLVILSSDYQFLYESGSFPRSRLNQAAALPEVVATYRLNSQPALWKHPATGQQTAVLLFGLDDDASFVRDADVRRGLAALTDGRGVLADAFALADFGTTAPGTQGRINGVDVEIRDRFRLGLFIYADASAIVRNTVFPALAGRDADRASIGLVRIARGSDPAAVVARLRALLPHDVQVLERRAFLQRERDFFVDTKPIGIMVHVGLVIAFVAGATLMLQVVSTGVQNRIREFATLKAMGFGPGFVFGVGLAEGLLLGAGAFALACAAAALLFHVIRTAAHLPATLGAPLLGLTAGFTLAMLVLSLLSATRRIARSDPAELY